MAVTIYFDGSFSSKTKEMYAGVVCGDEHLSCHTGLNGTSSDHAEWLAAAFALEYAANKGFKNIVMIGDSDNVIGAMSRGQKTNETLRPTREYVEGISADLGIVAWEKVIRDDNLAGQLLERLRGEGKLPSTGIFG